MENTAQGRTVNCKVAFVLNISAIMYPHAPTFPAWQNVRFVVKSYIFGIIRFPNLSGNTASTATDIVIVSQIQNSKLEFILNIL